jgi:hypothetical protein
MGTIIGFLIGYFLGLRDGKNGSASEITEAWNTIRKSDEFKAVLSSAPSIMGQVVRQGARMLAGPDK